MALSSEDKADVKGAMGRAIANKVSKVTRDYPTPKANPDKAKAYDAKHGKDAYHYAKTKIGRAQSKAYDAYFSGGAKSKALSKKSDLEARSKKAGYYVHGHKNLGDVYEA